MIKSHVSLGQVQCPVCGVLSDSVEILLHARLKPVLDRHTVTGWGMCPEHQKLKDEGYIAIIEADGPPPSGDTGLNTPRTGRYLHMRASVWPRIISLPVPSKGIAFVGVETMEKLIGMAATQEQEQ